MKKLIITIAIVLGLCMTSFADGGGLFQRGANPEQESGIYGNRTTGANTPALPTHGLENNQDAPLGTGIAILGALGGAYLVGKRRKKAE